MKIHIFLVKYSTILLVSQTTALASGAQEKASNGLLLQALLRDGLQGRHGAGGLESRGLNTTGYEVMQSSMVDKLAIHYD